MKLTREAKRTSRALLRLSLRDGIVDEQRAAGIVKLLVKEQPRHVVQILKEFQRLLRLELNKQLTLVESAAELSAPEKKKVIEVLQSRHGDQIDPQFEVSPDLIGGLRVQVGSNVWDGTIKGRLDRLSQKL